MWRGFCFLSWILCSAIIEQEWSPEKMMLISQETTEF